MINVDTPIMNGFVPANPIMNSANIGQNYNNNNMGGYYTGNYQYYNPYLIQEQQKAYEAKLREQQRSKSDIMKFLTKSAYTAMGKDIDDEYLTKYDVTYENNQPDYNSKESKYYRLMQISNTQAGYSNNNNYNNYISDCRNRYITQEEEKYKGQSYLEIIDTMNSELNDIYNRKIINDRRRNVSNMYNQGEYSQLISRSNPFSMYNKYDNIRDCDISDNEIQLPKHLMTPYMEKKKAFFALLNKDKEL